MKKIIKYTLILAVFILCITFNVHAQYTITSNDGGTTAYTGSTSYPIGNTFTCTGDGELQSLRIIAYTSTSNNILKIYAGDGTSGTLLGTLTNINLTTSPDYNTYNVIDLSSLNISVTNGNVYTFLFDNNSSGVTFGDDMYGNGHIYYGSPLTSYIGYDVYFQIEVSAPLPVELTSFSANKNKNSVLLVWKTSTEVNNYGFEIQRSESNVIPGGVEGWTKIGFVKGSGNSNSPKNYSFIDTNPVSGKVKYRLKQIDNSGEFTYSSKIAVNSIPSKYELSQNYPNPFNPTTTIEYAIPKAEHVTLKVYDELGREVATLVNGNKEAGNYSVKFTIGSTQFASGIYYYRISAGEFSEVKKLILLK